MHTTKDVPITSISSTFQIRESTDEKHVQEIMQSIQDDGWKPGEFLDVIQPDPEQEKFKLADGNHRLQALKRLGWETAPIRIIGSTDLDLRKGAYRVNAGHGKSLNRKEKENFIKETLAIYCGIGDYEWSITRFCEEFEGLFTRPTVQKYRDQLEQAGVNFPEATVGADGRKMPTKKNPSKFKILNLPSPNPSGQTFCTNGCGTPIWDEMKDNPDCQYVERDGHWFCSEECADEWNQNRLSDEAERLTGISDKLPANPSARVATKPNPINYPACPATPVKTEASAVSGDVLEDFTDADEPTDVLRLEISKNDDETTIAEKISQIFDFIAPSININNIINILINKFNIIINAPSDKKSKSKKSKKREPLPEEEQTGLKWPLVDGTEWELSKTELEDFKKAYPAVDVEDELRRCIIWSKTRPRQRKTINGILKHLDIWLDNEQNKGGTKSGYGNTNQGQRQNRSRYRDAGLSFEDMVY